LIPFQASLLLFRSEADYEAYLDLGSSRFRDGERRALVKLAVSISANHRCSPIASKAYRALEHELPHFTLEELSDVGEAALSMEPLS
jgi:hypothetical protein